MLNVQISFDVEADLLARCRKKAGKKVRVVVGEDPKAETHVWVAGGSSMNRLNEMPHLRAVVVPWAGPSADILKKVSEREGVSLHNLHHNDAATAETAIALLMAVAKRVVIRHNVLKEGQWSDRFGGQDGVLLYSKQALVLGYGAIGKHIGKVCKGLGMKVWGIRTERRDDDPTWVFGRESLMDLLPKTQVLLCALPGTPETEGMMGAEQFAALPVGAIVVNVGRGSVFEEDALYDALKTGHLGGAGLDVWYVYPRSEEEATFPGHKPFHELPNVVMSPHRGGNAAGIEPLRFEALGRLFASFADGKWEANRIDPDKGY